MLFNFPEDMLLMMLPHLRNSSLHIVTPALFAGLLMLFIRPWFGEIRLIDNPVSNLQFTLKDNFLVMTLIGVATAWLNYVANIPLYSLNASRMADIIPIVPLIQTALWYVAMAIPTVWFWFSKRGRTAGLVLMVVVFSLQNRDFLTPSFWRSVYMWSVLLASLAVFRFKGYRLLGRAP